MRRVGERLLRWVVGHRTAEKLMEMPDFLIDLVAAALLVLFFL